MNNRDYPAFPVNNDKTFYQGLSKREYFAIQILPTIVGINSDDTPEDHCQDAIEYADLLMHRLLSPISSNPK